MRRGDGVPGGRVGDWGGIATAGLGLYCVSFLAWTLLGGAPGPAKAAITDVALLPAGLLAALLAVRASRSDRASPAARGAWRRLTLAFVLYSAGDLVWGIYKIGLRPVPAFSVSFSVATLFYVAYYPSFLAGLLGFPTVLRSRSRRLEFWLDAATVLLGGSMVVWHFVLGPVAAHSSGSTAASLLYLFYPVGDLVLLLAAAVTILSRADDAARRSFLWLVAGLVAEFVADLIQGTNALGSGLASGGPADGLFMLHWFCYGMSAHVFHGRARPEEGSEPVEPARSVNVPPYAAVLVGYGVLLFAVVLNWSTTFGGLVAWAIALTGVVLARQVASERENLRLLGERAARKSEARFRTLVQNASDVIVVVDADRRIRYLTPSVERVLGHRADDLLARPLATLVHPADLARALDQLVEAAGQRSVVGPAEWRVRGRDDAWRHVEATALSLLADPDIEGIVLTLRDVHERMRAEEERERLHAAIEGAAAEWQRTVDAVDTSVLILGREGRITRINRSARDLMGRGYAEILTRRLEDLGSDQPWRTAAHLVGVARATGRPAAAQAVDESDQRTWDMTAYLTAASGTDGDRTILVIQNITHLVALQESLRHSETMAAMGSLVAGVAHEVRNALFGISASVDALASELGGREDYAEYANVLRSQVARLNQLTRDLLDYGKPPILKTATTRPGGILQRVVRSCAPMAREHGVAVDEDVAPDLPDLEVDASRMEQVFENLVANAIQHSPRGGRVRVAARLVPGRGAPVDFSVEDEGAGVVAADIPRLFEPFFSRRKGGTGLGLSIVQRIVEAHGGRVIGANRPGGGAVFTVTLPAGRPVQPG